MRQKMKFIVRNLYDLYYPHGQLPWVWDSEVATANRPSGQPIRAQLYIDPADFFTNKPFILPFFMTRSPVPPEPEVHNP